MKATVRRYELDDKTRTIDLEDEQSIAPLRPYLLDTTEVQMAAKRLAGLYDRRHDLFGVFMMLQDAGELFVCRQDQAATNAAGRTVLRYCPSDRLAQIVAAFEADGEGSDSVETTDLVKLAAGGRRSAFPIGLIETDHTQRRADYDELVRLSLAHNFDLFGTIRLISEVGAPITRCQVDDVVTVTAGGHVVREQLCEWLQVILVTLRARNPNPNEIQ